jgi:hypothetical protein
VRASLKCLPLNRTNLLEALRVARIILIGTHGTEAGALVFERETDVGGAEMVSVEELKRSLSLVRHVETRMVFVGACHSEKAGIVLKDLGVDYVVAITGNERVRNVAARSFFRKFLEAALGRAALSEAVEKGIQAVETNPEIPEERRKFQRQKFICFPREKGRTHLFDEGEFLRRDLAQDLTETSELFGFRQNRDWPGRLIGRHEFILQVIRLLFQKKKVFIIQSPSDRGMGSSAILHFLAKYLSDRFCFRTISMQTSFETAGAMLANEEDSPQRLVLIDPMVETMRDVQVPLDAIDRSKSHVVVVVRSLTGREYASSNWAMLKLPPLSMENADQLQTVLLEEIHLSLPFLAPHANPSKIIQWVKAEALKQPKWADLVDKMRKGHRSWDEVIEALFRECVVGPQLWPRKERRALEEDEVAFIKSLSETYPTSKMFWEKWLEPTIATMSALEPYWTNRSIMGFVSEDRTNTVLLKGHEPGTFLFRTSVREPGKLTLSYVSEIKTVKKTLFSVQRTDGTINMESESGSIVRVNLWEGVKALTQLKKVLVRFGRDISPVDKFEAFTDVY